MRNLDVDEAKMEAERFLKRVKTLKEAWDPESDGCYGSSKEASAVKRASLDLSRALADLRRPA